MRFLLLFSAIFLSSNAAVLSKRKGVFKSELTRVSARNHRVLAQGNQTLVDYTDDYYMGYVYFGTPQQIFYMLLDTGSSDTWIVDCNQCSTCHDSGKKCFNSSSSSFTQVPQTCGITFGNTMIGTLPLNCSYGRDVINMAGLSYKTQQFAMAADDGILTLLIYDGVLGMGWPSLAENNVVPPLQNLLSQLDKPLFSIWLDRIFQQSYGGYNGMVTYGAIDTENCDPNINYVKLTSLTYWQFSMSGFSVGSFSTSKTVQAISATGTAWIGGPKAAIDAIRENTGARRDNGSGLWIAECTKKGLPDLVFSIGGNEYRVSSMEYLVPLDFDNGNCALTIYSLDGTGFGPNWVLGTAFVRSYCNFFDIGNQRIGFSKSIYTQHS